MYLLRKGQNKKHPKGIHSLEDYNFRSKYDYEYIVYVKMLSEEKYIHRLSGDWTIKSIVYDNDKTNNYNESLDKTTACTRL